MSTRTYRYLICGLLFVFFVGCVPAVSVAPTVAPTPSPSSISSVTPVPFPSQTASAVSTSTPSLHFYYPKVDKLCPEKREVSFDRLGISNDLKIILSDSNQTGLWRLHVDTPSPQSIQKLAVDKWISNSISPDGKRLTYTISNQDHSFSTWILSLDSGEQHEIINIDYLEGATSSARWLSQNELLVVGSCAGAGCPFPLEVINIDTGESLDVSGVDKEPYDGYQTFYVDAGKYYALYSAGNVGDDYIDFYAYDYLSRQKIQLFPWLQDKIFFYPYIGTNLGMDFYLHKIFMMVEQSYGYDLGVVHVSIEALAQKAPYDVVMKRVIMNDRFYELGFSFAVLNPSNSSLILSMSYIDLVNTDLTSNPQKIEDALFMLDLDHPKSDPPIDYLVFTDYCFATTGYYVNEVSPDGKIVVLNSDENIILLNLETGYIAYLPGWRFVGWAK